MAACYKEEARQGGKEKEREKKERRRGRRRKRRGGEEGDFSRADKEKEHTGWSVGRDGLSDPPFP